MSVSNILSAKGRDVVTAKSDDTVRSVAQLLATRRIGAVVILNSAGKIDGIVSERDVVRVIAADGASALDHKVSKVMTSKVKTCSETDSEVELMAMMTANRIRHLPVVAHGKLTGMISIGDVVKHRIEAIEHEAQDLKAYIASAG
jgi:signal-transduction protein with cAMP-binding, CBS, and nucleotidyltransferase domain